MPGSTHRRESGYIPVGLLRFRERRGSLWFQGYNAVLGGGPAMRETARPIGFYLQYQWRRSNEKGCID